KEEAKTLESNGYCASPVSSTFYVLTGKPLSSSIAGHAVNFVEATVANPLNIFSAVTNNRELLIENELSSLMVLGGWLTALNTLILQGKTRPFVDGVKKMRQSAVEKLKRKEKIESTIAVDK
ncbi:MAG: hypothetical protein M1365_09235, partial [Actinobacteria bacterium]|nr:hypothetical protein [Actinomycetota bacterium]